MGRAAEMIDSSVLLPAFGSPTRPDVGDKLEHQLDLPVLALLSRLPLARRLVR